MQIPIDHIKPNPRQPRQNFDQVTLKELAQSIEEHGVLQPIGVVMTDESDDNGYFYAIQFGERRWRASQMAGLAEIPAVVIDPDGLGNEADILARGLIENIQREDLSPLEVAVSYQRLADLGWTDAQIAQKMGKSRSTVANTRRLLNLPDDHRQQVATGDLTERQAMSLLTYYQLPEQVREKLAGDWHFKEVISCPEKLTSDQIRDKLKSSLDRVTYELKPFAADDVLTGGGIRHSKCTDCPFYIKALSQKGRCTDEACYRAKRKAWQSRELQAGAEQTGLPTLDPGRDLRWNDCTDFYSYSHPPVLKHALAEKCPNLSLRCNIHPDSGMRPKNVSKYIQYTCIHPGKSGCSCENALKAGEKEAQKEEDAEKKRLKTLAIRTVTAALADTSLPALKALALYSAAHSKYDKIAASTDPAWLAELVASHLVERKYSEWNSVEGNRSTLSEWLTQIGLSLDGHASAIPNLDARLERIAGWVKDLRKTAPTPEQITGNLSNLAELAIEAQQLQDTGSDDDRAQLAERKIFTGIDELKTTLLALRSLVERGNIDQVEIKHVSWIITVPASDINFKSHLKEIERPITLDYILILMPLFGETKTARSAIEARRRKLEKETEQITTQHLTAVAQELDQIAAHLEDEEIAYLTLKNYRDRLQEIFTTQLDLPGLAANKENNDLLHRWEELVKQVADRLENFQYRKMELPEEPTHE